MKTCEAFIWAFPLTLWLACGADETDSKNQTGPTRGDGMSTEGDSDGECGQHEDCIEQHGEHWICRSDRTCVSLLSDQCTFVRGDDTRDDAVFVGVLGVEGSPMFALSDLVRRDFERSVRGLPTGGDMTARSFVLVGCSYGFGGDPLPGARHLVETIGVPAIVGPVGSEATLTVAQKLAVPNGALLISPVALSDLVTDLVDDDLVFRTSPTTRSLAQQVAAMVSDLEPTVRALRSTTQVKVALVTSRDAYGLGVSNALLPRLRFNEGLSAEENEAQGQFLAVSYDADEEGYEREVAERVRAFAPHIVVALTSLNAEPFIAIEEAFDGGPELPPYYVSDHAGGSFEHDQFVMSRPDSLRSRIRTVMYRDPTRPLSDTYAARIEAEFGDSPSLLAAPDIYDAMYTVAYGVVAAGESALTGRAIARGIRQLVGPGDKIELVSEQIGRGVKLLQAGERIDLEGVNGPLDFDANGDVLVDGGVGCYVRDTATGSVRLVFSGQVYRAKAGKLEGTFSACD